MEFFQEVTSCPFLRFCVIDWSTSLSRDMQRSPGSIEERSCAGLTNERGTKRQKLESAVLPGFSSANQLFKLAQTKHPPQGSWSMLNIPLLVKRIINTSLLNERFVDWYLISGRLCVHTLGRLGCWSRTTWKDSQYLWCNMWSQRPTANQRHRWSSNNLNSFPFLSPCPLES